MIIMTSHKKSSGFEFWSCVICVWPWCICPPNFAQIALSNSELLTFSEIQDGDRRHLGCFGYSSMLIVPHLCSVANFVQISVIVRRSFDHVSRINFRFRLLVTWSSPRRRAASSHNTLMQDIFIQSKVIDIFPKFKMEAAAIFGFSVYVNLAIPACW